MDIRSTRVYAENEQTPLGFLPESPLIANLRLIAHWLIDHLWSIPFIALVWFVAKYSVDVPYLDQWGLPYLFYGVARGQPLIPMLLMTNNEHPVVFPKLIWIALAFTTKWNTRVDLAITLLLTFAMFIAIARMVRGEEQVGTSWISAVTLLVASLLAFSFVHYGDWLFGFQLHWALTNACTVWALYLVCTSARYPVRKQLLAWACCLVASFSALYGMLSWLVIVPAQLAATGDKRSKAKATAASVVLFGVCIAAYFLLLTRFEFPADRSFWLKHPFAALAFLFALMGAPLAQAGLVAPVTLAPLLGFALITLFIVCAASLLRANPVTSCVPWISIGLFAIGFSAMTTVARSVWGVGVAASESHYMSLAVLFAIATLELCRQTMRARPAVFVTLAFAVGALGLAGSIASLQIVRAIKRDRLHAAAFLEVERYIDPATDKYVQSCLFPLYPILPMTGGIRQPAELLGDLGFRKIAMHVPFIENPSTRYGALEAPAGIEQPSIVHDGGTVDAHGWVMIRDGYARSQIVLISIGDARVLITAAWVGPGRKAKLLRKLSTGEIVKPWSVQIPGGFSASGRVCIEGMVVSR